MAVPKAIKLDKGGVHLKYKNHTEFISWSEINTANIRSRAWMIRRAIEKPYYGKQIFDEELISALRYCYLDRS
jgi:hypothetical protein